MGTVTAMCLLPIVMVTSDLSVMITGEVMRLTQCAGNVIASVLFLAFVIFLRQLGYSSGLAKTGSSYGNVPSTFAMDNVVCSSSDHYLQDCSYDTYDNCGAAEGAGVNCYYSGE